MTDEADTEPMRTATVEPPGGLDWRRWLIGAVQIAGGICGVVIGLLEPPTWFGRIYFTAFLASAASGVLLLIDWRVGWWSSLVLQLLQVIDYSGPAGMYRFFVGWSAYITFGPPSPHVGFEVGSRFLVGSAFLAYELRFNLLAIGVALFLVHGIAGKKSADAE